MVIVRGNMYALLCVMPDNSIKYRDAQGFVNIAPEGQYRIIEMELI